MQFCDMWPLPGKGTVRKSFFTVFLYRKRKKMQTQRFFSYIFVFSFFSVFIFVLFHLKTFFIVFLSKIFRGLGRVFLINEINMYILQMNLKINAHLPSSSFWVPYETKNKWIKFYILPSVSSYLAAHWI